jgi:hypothetical protein
MQDPSNSPNQPPKKNRRPRPTPPSQRAELQPVRRRGPQRAPVVDLLLEILCGAVIWAVVALPAVVINLVVPFLDQWGVDPWLVAALRAAEYFVFAADSVLALTYVIATVAKHVTKAVRSPNMRIPTAPPTLARIAAKVGAGTAALRGVILRGLRRVRSPIALGGKAADPNASGVQRNGE